MKTDMNSPNSSLLRHLISLLSFVFVTLNLLFWLPLLLLAAAVRLTIPVKRVQNATAKAVEYVYRAAVNIDAWWFSNVLGIEFEIDDPIQILPSLLPAQSPVIICNHQSWFDIFLLQSLISRRGPILKFVIKVELLWVPVLGWVCLALNFPRLRRKSDNRSRSKDRSRVRSASLTLATEPSGLLIFPEGTRFNETKRVSQASPYQYLLAPRSGGFTVIQESMPAGTRLLDVSIAYNKGDADCWRCMSGLVDSVQVKVESFDMQQIDEPAPWLNERWLAKEAWLANRD